ncbi:MAG: hypothetical protein AAFQ74_10245 [Cyanobacteria bacterium J06623_4]
MTLVRKKVAKAATEQRTSYEPVRWPDVPSAPAYNFYSRRPTLIQER